ncbi:MAG: anti-sigma factor family protein [Solirubrobacteraceae bacterium]
MTQLASDPPPARSVLHGLLGPPGPQLTCEQCFELLDEYVELELANAAADRLIPRMRAHLDGCPACHEEHDSLRALLACEHSS